MIVTLIQVTVPLPVMLQLMMELISSVTVNGVVVFPGNISIIMLCSVQCNQQSFSYNLE